VKSEPGRGGSASFRANANKSSTCAAAVARATTLSQWVTARQDTLLPSTRKKSAPRDGALVALIGALEELGCTDVEALLQLETTDDGVSAGDKLRAARVPLYTRRALLKEAASDRDSRAHRNLDEDGVALGRIESGELRVARENAAKRAADGEIELSDEEDEELQRRAEERLEQQQQQREKAEAHERRKVERASAAPTVAFVGMQIRYHAKGPKNHKNHKEKGDSVVDGLVTAEITKKVRVLLLLLLVVVLVLVLLLLGLVLLLLLSVPPLRPTHLSPPPSPPTPALQVAGSRMFQLLIDDGLWNKGEPEEIVVRLSELVKQSPERCSVITSALAPVLAPALVPVVDPVRVLVPAADPAGCERAGVGGARLCQAAHLAPAPRAAAAAARGGGRRRGGRNRARVGRRYIRIPAVQLLA